MQATSILSRFSPSMLASLATGLLVLWPSPFIRSTAMSASMGLAGYSVASKQKDTKTRSRRPGFLAETGLLKAKDRAIDDLQDRVLSQDTELKMRHANARQLEATINDIQAAKAKVTAELARLKRSVASNPSLDCDKVYALMTEKNTLIESLNLEVSLLSAALGHADDDRLAAIADVHARAVMTPSRRSELESTIEDLTTEKEALAATVASLAGTVEAIDSTATATIEGCEKDYQALLENAEARLLECQALIADLQAKVNTPGRFGGLGDADRAGNYVIDHLARNGIVTSAVETDPDPDKGLLVTLRPQTAIALADVQKLAGTLETGLGLCAMPTVTIRNGLFAFRLAVNPLKNAAATVTLGSNLSRLEQAIDLANHLRIVGSSGSGKSTFLDNAIWCGRVAWPDSRLEIGDPKYPYTPWSNGLKPTFKGAESCVDAVIDLAEKMEMRLETASEAVDNGGVIPDFPRYIFALDEATVALSRAKTLEAFERKGDKLAVRFGASLGSLLRLGRALGFKGYFLSQSLLVSKVGLNDGDFENATSIYLNSMIDRAIEGELKELFNRDRLTAIAKEYDRRKEQGQAYVGLVADSNRDELFLLECPVPGYYAGKYHTEHGSTLPAVAGDANSPTAPVKTMEAISGNGGTVSALNDRQQPAEAVPTPKVVPIPTVIDTRCPSCAERSTRAKGKVRSNGSQSFECQNNACDKKTFSVKVS